MAQDKQDPFEALQSHLINYNKYILIFKLR